jgi:hypothetical protein
MPSSVLLAILVGAGVLALMPALVRRYDSAVRGQAEFHSSSMRVLGRSRRRRTVPGRAPVRPPSFIRAPDDGRIIGRAAVPYALTPGDAESDALVRAALRAAAPTTSAAVSAAALAEATRAVPAVRRSIVDDAHVRQWRRFQRRRILLAFAVLFLAQTAGALVVDPVFWAGVGASAVLTAGYVARLRVAAAAERRQLVAERVARRRAYEFVRVATRHATRVDHTAATRAAAWLATPRQARRRPSREVARVLAIAGREAVEAEDGTWVVRRAPDRVTTPRRPLLARGAARPSARSGRGPAAKRDDDDPDATLPRAVNY